MFVKANQNFVAANASANAKNAPLEKQLFPSSSPAPPSSDIRDQLKKRTSGFSAAAQSPSAGRGGQFRQHPFSSSPLDSRSTNTPFKAGGSGTGRGSLASLYGNSGSSAFKNPDNFVDLTASDDAASKKVKEAVFFQEDDFSDDDDLDLDFVAPKSLPSLPPSKPSIAKENVPPPSSGQGQPIPWTSSPDTHFMHPKQYRSVSSASQNSQNSMKRESSGDNDSFQQPSQNVAKKRRLPDSFKKTEPEPQPKYEAPSATPKSKSYGAWDPTASAIKEQKKQLKNQRSAAAAAKPVPPPFDPDGDAIFQKSGDMTENGSAGPTSDTVTLSAEQRQVLHMVVEQGKSVFFTGPAGTGKSVLMRAIIQELKVKYGRESSRVAVTASTGLAACNIGGVTLHSFAGKSLEIHNFQ